MGILAALKFWFERRYPAHQWEYDGCDKRTCTICGCGQELDMGGGHSGSMWDELITGDRAAHVTAVSPLVVAHVRILEPSVLSGNELPS